ncbi:hypothetical protein [Rugamonas aquatica]|uniref:Uncharacterized protein n=1 Tax=Rugamonas aquatica TaxID=2743357 RepID=A0A6A7N6Y5_9BURK|nr:hypothetical protein [Rugamonas aquatica]MQA40638.1 hypothetical protein [Rugamonas aquatica]
MPKNPETASGCEPFELVGDDQAEAAETIPPWTEEEVVHLHWRLLSEVKALDRPGRSLEDKIDILRWVFADGALEARPFSFVSCIRVVGSSPLSPLEYMGRVDADEVRCWIQQRLRRWFDEAFSVYPSWVREAIVLNPQWVARSLDKNPQWLNQQISSRQQHGDLFA